MIEVCKNCTYWEEGTHDSGLCRRRSPVVLMRSDDTIDQYWPQTYSFNWCGEFVITAKRLVKEVNNDSECDGN